MENTIIELRKNNKGYKTIAKELGVTRDYVRRVCRKNGLTGVMAIQIHTETYCKYCGKETEKKRKICNDCKTKIKEKNELQKNIKIKKCKYCGLIFKANRKTQIYCSTKCRDNDNYRQKNELQYIHCLFCGSEFFPQNNNQKYCSKKCCNYAGRKNEIPKRLKKCEIIQTDITLYSVAKKCNQTCWLCNKLVDWTDYDIDETGRPVHNKMYPTIDHVIPISLGGNHEWNNVRIAHRGCNTSKLNRTTREGSSGQYEMYL